MNTFFLGLLKPVTTVPQSKWQMPGANWSRIATLFCVTEIRAFASHYYYYGI